MIKRIMLDLDDVCNQCTKYALQWHGVPMDYSRFEEMYPSQYGYNIVEVANALLGYRRFDVPGFWNMLPRNFWASCPVSAEFEWLIHTLQGITHRDNICFLTSPTKCPECLAGKLAWIEKHAPSWMQRQYLVGPRKQFCAHPEALLIDDSDANVVKFREWGGQALLVPRPWNSLSGRDAREYLTTELRHV